MAISICGSVAFGEPNISHFEILSGLLVNDAVIFIGKTGHTAVKRPLWHGNIAADVLRLGSPQPFRRSLFKVKLSESPPSSARLVDGKARKQKLPESATGDSGRQVSFEFHRAGIWGRAAQHCQPQPDSPRMSRRISDLPHLQSLVLLRFLLLLLHYQCKRTPALAL